MINISFGKWFLENDTFTISLFNNSINEAKKLGGEGFLRKDILDHYTDEIKYRIEQFAYRLKDKEKIKQIVPSSILEDLAKQKKITINVLIDNIHDAANNYDKNQDHIEYASFLQNLHIHRMHPKGSEALEKSLSEKRKLGSRTKPNYIYRSIKPIDKIIDDDKSELKNPPENPKIGDRHHAQGYTWKFMSDRTWIKIRKDTNEYEGTELLDMFNRSKLDRPMLKAILHYYDKDYFNEKEVMKAFKGSCKHIGRNQLKQDIDEDEMVKVDPYEGDKNKIFERAKIKFPNPEKDNVYEDEETGTDWKWSSLGKTKGMGWKEILKEKPISHFSLHAKGEAGEYEHDVEGREKEENPLDPDSEYSSKEYDDETKGDYEVTKPFGIKSPQKKPIIDQEKPIMDIASGLTLFKEYLGTTKTLGDPITKNHTFISRNNENKYDLEIEEFYRKLFIEITDKLIRNVESKVRVTILKNLFLEKEPSLPMNAKKVKSNWARFTAEKYKQELKDYAYRKNFLPMISHFL